MSGDATPMVELKNYLREITGKVSKKEASMSQVEQKVGEDESKPKRDVDADGDAGRDVNPSEEPPAAPEEPEDSNEMYGDTLFKLSEGKKLMSIITNILAACEKPSEEIDLSTFRQIMFKTLNISQYFMITRVFRIFDTNGDKKISPQEYISGLSTLLRGSLEDHVGFAFKVYDVKRKGFLTKADVSRCLEESSEKVGLGHKRSGRKMSSELNDGLCDLIFPKMDLDKNGQISWDEFRTACLKDPTLVETFGPCLPKDSLCPLADNRKLTDDVHSDSLDYLMKVSTMTRLCTPFRTEVNRILKPIEIKPHTSKD